MLKQTVATLTSLWQELCQYKVIYEKFAKCSWHAYLLPCQFGPHLQYSYLSSCRPCARAQCNSITNSIYQNLITQCRMEKKLWQSKLLSVVTLVTSQINRGKNRFPSMESVIPINMLYPGKRSIFITIKSGEDTGDVAKELPSKKFCPSCIEVALDLIECTACIMNPENSPKIGQKRNANNFFALLFSSRRENINLRSPKNSLQRRENPKRNSESCQGHQHNMVGVKANDYQFPVNLTVNGIPKISS